jgi:hypothetical protein
MRKAKPTVAPGTLPSDATLREWFLLPLGPIRRKANAGVPMVIPVGGKRVLAQIAWPNDDSRQARFVKAGRRNPQGLSRKEYLQLANTDYFWVNDEFINDLLAEWAIRAAKSEPELAKHGEHFLRLFFTEQLVDFVLGRPLVVGPATYRRRVAATREPREIVRRYLLSENWKLTVELLALERRLRRLSTGPRKGTESWAKGRRLVRAEMRAAFEKIKIKYPLLKSQAELMDQTLHEHRPVDEQSGKAPIRWTRATLRRALHESKAQQP